MRKLMACLVALAVTSVANAGPITSRPNLVTLLGGPGTLENFEAFNIGFGSSTVLSVSTLNSSTIANGQGPGLVVPGVTFSATNIQWSGQGYFGSPSREIDGFPGSLNVDFTVPTNAFGIDLRAFSGFPSTAAIDIYASDDVTLVGTISGINLPTSGVPVFAGWFEAGGIGRITLRQTNPSWSPIIDNLQFGQAAAVPEPFSFVVFGGVLAAGGLAVRRRMKATA